MESSMQSFSSLGFPKQPSQDSTGGTSKLLSFINYMKNLCKSDVETTPLPVTQETQRERTNEKSFIQNLLAFFKESECVRKFFILVYGVFLLLQFLGLGVVYLPRAVVCCVDYGVTSYQCNGTILINNDIELELLWITAHALTGILCFCIVCKWHGAEGVKLILRKLKVLPKFWCILAMFILSGCTMALMLKKTEEERTLLQTATLLIFSLHYLTMVLLVPLLNYTAIFAFCTRKGYTRVTRILVKLTLVLMFLVNFGLFFVGVLELGFQVSGIDNNARGSFKFHRAVLLARQTGIVLFFNITQSFFWTKLFCDDKNILSHMQSL